MISLFVLLPLYCIVVQAERGGWWNLVLVLWPLAALVDVGLNYLTWSWLWGWPGKGQYTVTKRLSAAKHYSDWRAPVAQYLCRVLDSISPKGCHCK